METPKTEREIVHDICQDIFTPHGGNHCGPDGRYNLRFKAELERPILNPTPFQKLLAEYPIDCDHSCHDRGFPACPKDNKETQCIGCMIGGGSHYWTVACLAGHEYRYDSYDWKMREIVKP